VNCPSQHPPYPNTGVPIGEIQQQALDRIRSGAHTRVSERPRWRETRTVGCGLFPVLNR
jgi:hypothetical protein